LEQKRKFRQDPASLVAHAKSLEDKVNGGWETMLKDSEMQKQARKFFSERTATIVKDPLIASKITPTFAVGCRRITPGDPYLHAIQESNVKLVFEEAVKITPNSIIGADGTEVKNIDTIICATGFDTSFRPSFPIIGRRAVNLQEKWSKIPEGYLGLTVSSFSS
jgi:cation diffusion facilitator CzcD-associated flavoprotein CzcO